MYASTNCVDRCIQLNKYTVRDPLWSRIILKKCPGALAKAALSLSLRLLPCMHALCSFDTLGRNHTRQQKAIANSMGRKGQAAWHSRSSNHPAVDRLVLVDGTFHSHMTGSAAGVSLGGFLAHARGSVLLQRSYLRLTDLLADGHAIGLIAHPFPPTRAPKQKAQQHDHQM